MLKIWPLVWFFTYWATALAFALVYASMPGSFYAPYSKLEPQAVEDLDKIASTIERHVVTSVRDIARKYTTSLRAVSVDPVHPLNLNAADGGEVKGSLKLLYDVVNSDDLLVQDVEVTIQRGRSYAPSGQSHTVVSVQLQFKPRVWIDGFTPELFANVTGVPNVAESADLSAADKVLIVGYMEGANGDPTGFTGQLPRMIYFSTVTITTTGFGDIVPITRTARWLVTLETFLGIVVVGLFINSVGTGGGSRK